MAVQLPPGEEQNDWVAVYVVDFFNCINLIYSTISDDCTEQSCPVMSGGPKYEYQWQDEHKYRKPTVLSAPQYMNLLMDWIEVQINNEDIFPRNVGEFGLGGAERGWCRAFCFELLGPVPGPGDAVAQVTHRITEWWGLAGPSVGDPAQPPAEAGSPRAGCTALRPGRA